MFKCQDNKKLKVPWLQVQSIGPMNQYLLPNSKNDKFRIIRTVKGTSLQNSQKAFGKEIHMYYHTG